MHTNLQTTSPIAGAASPWRAPGVWLAVILMLYMLFNVIRTVQDPVGFAETFGTPLTNPADSAFVFVYAIRALFLAVFGLVLIVQMRWQMLALFILVATIMPVGDALLVASQGGESTIIIRHVVIAGVLMLTWFLLWRWNQGHTRA
jgi:hypothetical protein